MKTLYEILEVSETASKEIIEKAYKVLAKKYHPDLQPENEKAHAEQLMKEINEAYETLTDDTKRSAYDSELKAKREIEEQKASYNNMESNNNYKEPQSDNYQRRNSETSQMAQEELRKRQEEIKRQQAMQEEYQRNVREDYERKYRQAYEGYLRSLGYKIKYKWTWENYKKLFIIIISIIIICTIIWIFPPTHKMLVNLYESNNIIKIVVDIICNIFVSIGNALKSAMNFGKNMAP